MGYVAVSCATFFTCATRTMGHGDDSYNNAVPLAPSTLFTVILEHPRSHENEFKILYIPLRSSSSILSMSLSRKYFKCLLLHVLIEVLL